MPVINVSNAAQLRTVLRTVKGGDTILLAPGDYGAVSISSVNPSSLVTIRSADPNADAKLFSLSIQRSSNIAIADVDISRPTLANERPGTTNAVTIGSSRGISLTGIDLTGSLDNNASNDGLGINLQASQRVAILDSTFRQFRTAIVVTNAQDVIVAGNTITETREGVNMSGVRNGLFERNLVRDLQPDYAGGDHPDAFQVHTTSRLASANLMFRDNVVLEGSTPGGIGGFMIGNETWMEGTRHQNISIVNNFYQSTFRHGVSISGASNVLIDNNTVIDSARAGVQAGIVVLRVDNAQVTDNLAAVFTVDQSTRVISTNNIDVWDARSQKGMAAGLLFASDVAAGRASAASNLGPLAGSIADQRDIGYHATGLVGDLGSDHAAAAIAGSYMRMFDTGGFALL